MKEMLRKMFEANPEKSVIGLEGRCSDCGCDLIIEITPTSGGFGLQGGALLEYSSGGYFAKCPNCYKVDRMIEYPYKQKSVCVH